MPHASRTFRRSRPTAPGAARGFTLIELMVVVAVLGLLSSIAVTSYQNYIASAQTARVVGNYNEALRTARNHLAAAEATRSLGGDGSSHAPSTFAAWADLINPTAAEAPGGGPAYVNGAANVATGAVGIEVSGLLANGNLQITVRQPGYGDLSATSETVSQQS